jgi:hypothetical protein
MKIVFNDNTRGQMAPVSVRSADGRGPGLLKGTGHYVDFYYYGYYDGYPEVLTDKSMGEGYIEHGQIVGKQRSRYLPG